MEQISVIKNYTVWIHDVFGLPHQLHGVSGEITLPNFSYMSDSANCAGLMGTAKISVPGMMEEVSWSLPFASRTKSFFMAQGGTHKPYIFIAASVFAADEQTFILNERPAYISIWGSPAGTNTGTHAKAKFSNSEVPFNVSGYRETIDGVVRLHWDLYKGIYIVNGIDQNALTRAIIGMGV
jgi:phage tail tube protein FII